MADSHDCSAGWCAHDDFCAITCTADLLGRKWHPVIVHRLLEEGPLGFNALQDAVGDIASNVLSDNLERLQEHDIVHRRVVNEQPFRVEYALTDLGEDLQPIIDAMADWGEKHLQGSDEATTA